MPLRSVFFAEKRQSICPVPRFGFFFIFREFPVPPLPILFQKEYLAASYFPFAETNSTTAKTTAAAGRSDKTPQVHAWEAIASKKKKRICKENAEKMPTEPSVTKNDEVFIVSFFSVYSVTSDAIEETTSEAPVSIIVKTLNRR